LNTCGAIIDCEKEKILTKFDGESYDLNFSKFAKAPYKTELPNEDFTIEQLASIALAPNDALQQYMEDHKSEIFMEETNEIDEILLHQPEMHKHNLPLEDLGTTLPPKEDPIFYLKTLPDDLKYAYIDDKKLYPVIISSKLSGKEEERLLEILRKHRGTIGYTLDDLKRISPTICQHAINMEPGEKLVVEHQCRLIPKMKEAVRNEVLKLLDASIIYPIADSRWVSPVHCVPKKGGITIVPNENNELIPQRVVVGYRMCIDFRKVNKVTKKDHYPLPFIDQMLESLSKKTQFCFLDGYSGFSQIAVKKQDHEKTTFTCPYGTYAYRRMPFGLCNAPATFQRCMSAIFHGFCEEIWRYSWRISPSMELLLITACTILIKFCRDVRKLILFLIGRNATLWLMKELFLDIKFLKEVLKLTEQKLKQSRKCPVLGILKVFVVFLVMLVFIGGLLKIFIKFQSLLLIFFKKMYLLFLMMIVRKLSKFLRRL
jgi:hypothetical protein